MIDYKMIGARIRAIRNARKMTQEQLAEAVGVGVTHISHIETGNSIPSLQVVINIINALNCSADELLFMDVQKASPEINGWLTELVADCSQEVLATYDGNFKRHSFGAELQAVGIGLFFAAVLVLDGVGQPKSGLPL